MNHAAEIRKLLQGDVTENDPLSRHTWYQIGGPADLYCVPATIDDIVQLVDYCRRHQLPFMVLGKGSNLLVSDRGYRGVVMDLSKACAVTRFAETHVQAGTGVYMPKLVMDCEREGLAGIEMFAGIPGTLGGALKMNAGCHGREMADVVSKVTLLQHGRLDTLDRSDIAFEYRHVSTFDDETLVLLSADLQLQRDNPEELAARRKEYMKKRQQTQPINLPSSGSVFKNPPGQHAGRLIESCDLKGMRIGGAAVSDKHANFIVNEREATAQDVFEIIRRVRQAVFTTHQVWLELEVKLVGFTEDELNFVGQS